jgi:hypothetical protein
MTMYDQLIKTHIPKEGRALKAAGGIEHHLTEGAVMMAFAMHLLQTVPDLKLVSVHPDGEHAKNFDFADWLSKQGFAKESSKGSTAYGGVYCSAKGQRVVVNPKSGVGDVVADLEGKSYVAECKGGVINSTHAGQLSRLRKGLCETVGLSLASDAVEGRRQFAVVPKTRVTTALAKKMAGRAKAAGIEIALVDCVGHIEDVAPA